MDHKTLAQLDLNNLVALDALLETRSVTRAAAVLNVTQPAMSHTLKRLRSTLDDPLFVRHGHAMLPTPAAEALKLPLRIALEQLQHALSSPGEFNPASTPRSFRVATSDFVSLTFMPLFCGLFREQAPNACLIVTQSESFETDLVAGTLDVLLAPVGDFGSGIMARKLYDERFVAVIRKDHARVGETLDLNTYVKLPHLLISPSGKGPGRVDHALGEQGLTRHVAMRTAHFSSATSIVAASDLILSCPVRLAKAAVENSNVRIVELPIDISGFSISTIWHERFTADPANSWLRDLLATTALDV